MSYHSVLNPFQVIVLQVAAYIERQQFRFDHRVQFLYGVTKDDLPKKSNK